MASIDQTIQVTLSREVSAALESLQKELLAAREALSEERIRAIVRDEMVRALRSGRTSSMETKSDPSHGYSPLVEPASDIFPVRYRSPVIPADDGGQK